MKLARLREWREAQGLTQKELAERAGIGLVTPARIEGGQGTTPRTARKIADALGVDIVDLLEEPPTLAPVRPKAVAPTRSGRNESPEMEEAVGFPGTVLREGAFHSLPRIIGGVYDRVLMPEEAESLIGELFIPQEEALSWIEERLLSGALRVEWLPRTDGGGHSLDLEDLEQIENRLGNDLISHIYAT